MVKYSMNNPWLQDIVDIYKSHFGDIAYLIMDIGTRDGDDAEYLRERLNAQNIYAVDARQDAVEATKRKYPKFNAIKACISDTDTEMVYFHQVVSDDKDYSGSSSIYNEKFNRPEYPYETIKMRTMTMKKLLKTYNISNYVLDIVKVDIEGFTYQLLTGMDEHIYQVKLFHLETEKWSTHRDHKNSDQVAEYMEKHGFILESKQYQWGPDIEDQIWVNPRFFSHNL